MRGRSAARWLLWAVFRIYVGETVLGRRSWGLRQASAPAAWASPGSDASVLPVPGAARNAGNSHGIACAPAPSGAGMAQGGLSITGRSCPCLPHYFPAQCSSAPNFFRQFSFSSGKIRAYKLSAGIFFYFSDFDPKFFAIFKFRGKNFPAKEISRPEKVRVSGFCGLGSGERFMTEKGVSCVTNTTFSNFRASFFSFFQISIQKFLGFSTFAAKKSGRTNFQSQIFCPEKISDCAGGT